MPFSSLFFLFFFLPVTLALYHLGNRRLRLGILLLASLLFYAWGGIAQLPLLLALITGNYLASLLLIRLPPGRPRQLVLTLGIVSNLVPLLYYKYSVFLTHNFLRLIPGLYPTPPLPTEQNIPLGISFLAFHAISYLVDVNCNRTLLHTNPLRLGLYLAIFPKLLSGPIWRYAAAAPQLHCRRTTLEDWTVGVERFILGLAKKLLLANTLADMADHVFAAPFSTLPIEIAWLGITCYTLQIYFDFSGYTDMAIGLGRMFGFHLPENFNYPYVSQSLREFWQRWHITLSHWFRDYLYIPLGGNRHSALKTYRNLVIVFLLCGLWHGASWNYVIWGLLHGTFLVLERWRLASLLTRSPRFVRHLYLLLFLQLSWVFFRSPTLKHAWGYLGAMLGLGTTPCPNPWILLKMDHQVISILALSALLALPVMPKLEETLRRLTGQVMPNIWLVTPLLRGMKIVFLSLLLWLAVMELAAGTYNPFIYFRF